MRRLLLLLPVLVRAIPETTTVREESNVDELEEREESNVDQLELENNVDELERVKRGFYT